MDDACFAVHGIAIKIHVHGDISARWVFPSLYRLPWPLSSEAAWHIEVFFEDPPASVGFAPGTPVSTLRIWPDTEVQYQEDSEGMFRALSQGTAAVMNPIAKNAHLFTTPEGVKRAEQLGRLVVQKMLRSEGFFVVHAGAVETHGGAVLICGSSGMGKSTLALAWASLGRARFMADDRCVVFRRHNKLWAGGIADQLGLTSSTSALLHECGICLPKPLGRDGDKCFYDCHDVFVSLCQDPYPIQAVLVLDRTPGQEEMIGTCPTQGAFAALWQGSFYPGTAQAMQDHFEVLTELATHVPCYRVPARSACEATVARLDALVEDRRPQVHPLYPQAQQCSLRSSPDHEAKATESLCRILCDPDEDVPWGQASWHDILRSADRHGLLAPLAAALEDRPKTRALERPLRNLLRTALLRSSEARLIHRDRLRALCEVLPREPGSWAIVNGPAVAERFYRVPASKYYHCIELIVAFDKVGQVTEALERLGYVRQSNAWDAPVPLDCDRPVWRNRIHLHELVLATARQAGAVPAPAATLTAPDLLRTARTLSYDDIHVPAVNDARQILLSCAAVISEQARSNLPELWDVTSMLHSANDSVCDEITALNRSCDAWRVLRKAMHRADSSFPDRRTSRLRTILSGPLPFCREVRDLPVID